jgi:hypothetical protein
MRWEPMKPAPPVTNILICRFNFKLFPEQS